MKLNYVVIILCVSVFFGCKPVKLSDSDPCYVNSERPSNAITYKEMASMFEQYDNKQKKVLDAYLGQEETISSFYAIEDLKQYIAYVERLSKEKKIPLTGIRIFSAAYPDNYKEQEYQKQQTLIFAPTTTINGKKGVAYEPLYSKKGSPIPMKEFLDRFSGEETVKVNRASILPVLSTTTPPDLKSSGANRLNPSPPM
jgi:hypothetical protein